MDNTRTFNQQFSVEELDRELIARVVNARGKGPFKTGGAVTPQQDAIMARVKEFHHQNDSLVPNQDLCNITTWELTQLLIFSVMKRTPGTGRGVWGTDERRDFYDIPDENVKRNAAGVAAICTEDGLTGAGHGKTTLNTANYKKAFNLSDIEPFKHQPVATGSLTTGFLVNEDTIATAAHCVNKRDVMDYRFVFGYKMLGPFTPVTQAPDSDIYKGKRIIRRIFDPNGSGADWALVKLDRKVSGRAPLTLSGTGVSRDQAVYVLGHPCGLPLKYAPGARIRDIKKAYFSARLDIYCGNSGSPVFNADSHEVVGIVVRGDNKDFRWTGRGWASVIYPVLGDTSRGAECTKTLEFINYRD